MIFVATVTASAMIEEMCDKTVSDDAWLRLADKMGIGSDNLTTLVKALRAISPARTNQPMNRPI